MRRQSSNTTHDSQNSEQDPRDKPGRDNDRNQPSDYYYDDSTGYEIYREDEDQQENQCDESTS